jgi:2-oxoglutarate dehydrogenase E2 component (dihydrolipoamide succinyltransferase)
MEVKVPQLPESVADATLVAWHCKVGDAVRRDENLVDLETDKVVLEVPAPANGVVVEIRAADGATVTSGDVLAVIDPSAEAGAAAEAGAGADTEPAAAGSQEAGADGSGHAAESAPATTGAASSAGTPVDSGPARMGPAVRKLVDEHDIDPAAIRGSGRDGLITKTDVLNFLASHQDSHADVDESHGEGGGGAGSARSEQRVPMTRLRARIAERLVEAQATAAMLTTFNEIDMTEVIAIRNRYKEDFQKRHDVKLGFMSFFVRASIEALRQFPLVNASVDGNDVVYHEYFDVGVAVSTDRGLVVPVLRDAEHMSFADIEKSIVDFGTRARNGSLGMDDLTGGTFTITNGGIFGSLMSTPILNPPQSGILGMHKIQERPMVVDGEIVARPMMYIALTYDHRIIDGREAVQFLVHLKQQLEDPARLILQV